MFERLEARTVARQQLEQVRADLKVGRGVKPRARYDREGDQQHDRRVTPAAVDDP